MAFGSGKSGGGKFGGGTANQMLTVSVDVPINMRLKFDSGRVAARVGRRIASKIKRNIKRGVDYDGNALLQGKDGGPPLRDSGDLLKSIRYRKSTATIEPTGKRTDTGPRLGSNYALMSWHIQTRDIDPMSTGSTGKIYEDVAAETERAIAKEIESGKATLVSELKRASKGRKF